MTDPYTEVADYIASRVTLLDYGTWLVKLSLDGRQTTEMLSYDREDGFTWSNDWYEGESDVHVIDFADVNDIDPAMRWHSIKNDGLPPEGTECIVTVEFFDGTRNVYDGYKWRDGMWRYWSEQYEEWEDMDEDADEQVIAWMPYPNPYGGE